MDLGRGTSTLFHHGSTWMHCIPVRSSATLAGMEKIPARESTKPGWIEGSCHQIDALQSVMMMSSTTLLKQSRVDSPSYLLKQGGKLNEIIRLY
mmetsp:Transcript_5205/g.12455  ORF Transcript_5205/g.12455 Transcript_5205/m.12455 type:complete len:94 (+) Transcript_5205:824-1105(+)